MSILKITILTLTIFMLITFGSKNEKNEKEAKGLKVGQTAPVFRALDADSNLFSIEEALINGPVVLIFYRGFWCPVCNEHLGSIQDSLAMIETTGAKAIAVSPENPFFLDKMADKTGAEFTLLYDEDYKIANAYDVNFTPSTMKLFTYNVALGAKLKESHSDESQKLPIPATYIINQNGKIVWRQFDPDYHNRASVRDIMEVLKDEKHFNEF